MSNFLFLFKSQNDDVDSPSVVALCTANWKISDKFEEREILSQLIHKNLSSLLSSNLDIQKITELLLTLTDAIFSFPLDVKLVNNFFMFLNTFPKEYRSISFPPIINLFLERCLEVKNLAFSSAGPWILIKEFSNWPNISDNQLENVILLSCTIISEMIIQKFILNQNTQVDKALILLKSLISMIQFCPPNKTKDLYPYICHTMISILMASEAIGSDQFKQLSLSICYHMLHKDAQTFINCILNIKNINQTNSSFKTLNENDMFIYCGKSLYYLWTIEEKWNLLTPVLPDLLLALIYYLPYLYSMLVVSPNYSSTVSSVVKAIITCADSSTLEKIEGHLFQHIFHPHIICQWFALDIWCILISLGDDNIQIRYADILIKLIQSLEELIYPSFRNKKEGESTSQFISTKREQLRFSLLNIIMKVLICMRESAVTFFYNKILSSSTTLLESKQYLIDILPLPSYQNQYSSFLKICVDKMDVQNIETTSYLLLIRSIKKLMRFEDQIDIKIKQRILKLALEKIYSSKLLIDHRVLKELFGIILSLRSEMMSKELFQELLSFFIKSIPSLIPQTMIIIGEFVGVTCDCLSAEDMDEKLSSDIGLLFDNFFSSNDWTVVEESMKNFQILLSKHHHIYSKYIEDVCLYLDKKEHKGSDFQFDGQQFLEEQQKVLIDSMKVKSNNELKGILAEVNYDLDQLVSRTDPSKLTLIYEIAEVREKISKIVGMIPE